MTGEAAPEGRDDDMGGAMGDGASDTGGATGDGDGDGDGNFNICDNDNGGCDPLRNCTESSPATPPV